MTLTPPQDDLVNLIRTFVRVAHDLDYTMDRLPKLMDYKTQHLDFAQSETAHRARQLAQKFTMRRPARVASLETPRHGAAHTSNEVRVKEMIDHEEEQMKRMAERMMEQGEVLYSAVSGRRLMNATAAIITVCCCWRRLFFLPFSGVIGVHSSFKNKIFSPTRMHGWSICS